MTTLPEPGERRPGSPDGTGTTGPTSSRVGGQRVTLDRPPGDRYVTARSTRAATDQALAGIRGPVVLVAGGTVAFVVLGGILTVTAGLVVLAGILGWLTGLLVRPPLRAAAVAVVVVAAGLLGIWLFGRWEGGVMNPIEYFAEIQGIVVPLEFLAAAGMAAAASQ
ncbi:MAG TPA: hypothetical protein VFY18_07615 [Candidatus Limnocylindrales bacterium]|nr:hypothetical protein [Candidatus Limnocylindrales bacterium]